MGLAEEQPARIGAARASLGQGLDLGAVRVGVEATDHPLAVGIPVALVQAALHRHAALGMASRIQGDDAEALQRTSLHPGIGLHAQQQPRGVDRHAHGSAARLAVSVAIFGFGAQFARRIGSRQILPASAGATAGV